MNIYSDHHVIVFDDDAFTAKLLETVLVSIGVGKVSVHHNLDEAKQYLMSYTVDCVMMEWLGWKKPSLEFLEFIRTSGKVADPMVPVIMCTGHTDHGHIVRARDAGANEVVAKPISPNQVFDKLYSALFKAREFISDDAFTGPDRRRHSREYQGEERRTGEALSQSDIDQVMVENK